MKRIYISKEIGGSRGVALDSYVREIERKGSRKARSSFNRFGIFVYLGRQA